MSNILTDRGNADLRVDGSAPTDPRLIVQPLAFIAAELVRQRRICADLDGLAAPKGGDKAIATDVLSHLSNEAPMHMADEDEDLFPLLLRRAEPEDELAPTLARLASDHGKSRKLLQTTAPILERIARNGRAATPAQGRKIAALAAHERHHLIVENAIILPLATARLLKPDLRSLALRMAARRGLDIKQLEAKPDRPRDA